MEISLPALRHNIETIRQRIGPSSGIMGVVKADAYGHGVEEIAQALAPHVGAYGVANLEEALEIEPLGLGKDILILGPSLPGERPEVVQHGFIATVSSIKEAGAFAALGTEEKPARLNLKIDTGMGRIGFWQDHALDAVEQISKVPGVSVAMISTHLPLADEDETYTRDQLNYFAGLAREFRKIVPGVCIHALNSGGVWKFPEHAHDLVRTGLMLYGSAYPPEYQSLVRPVMTWKSRIVLLRDVDPGRGISYGRIFVTRQKTRVATLPVGYADGFPRQVSGLGAEVLVGGKRCPVLGRVTMDQILVDVTTHPEVVLGEEAVIVGRQGSEEILAADLAAKAGTIAWDIFTGIKNRVHRFYLK